MLTYSGTVEHLIVFVIIELILCGVLQYSVMDSFIKTGESLAVDCVR